MITIMFTVMLMIMTTIMMTTMMTVMTTIMMTIMTTIMIMTTMMKFQLGQCCRRTPSPRAGTQTAAPRLRPPLSEKIQENQWKFLKIWENPGKAVKIYKNLRKIQENLWKSVKKLPRQIHKGQSWWRLPGWEPPTSLGSDDGGDGWDENYDDDDDGGHHDDAESYDDDASYYGERYDNYDTRTWLEMKRVLSGQRLS